MLDKAFYEEEVKRLCLAFEQQVIIFLPKQSLPHNAFQYLAITHHQHVLYLQFHYGVFFAYMRLREQEIRNLMWISECVAQNQKSRVHDSVVFIF